MLHANKICQDLLCFQVILYAYKACFLLVKVLVKDK